MEHSLIIRLVGSGSRVVTTINSHIQQMAAVIAVMRLVQPDIRTRAASRRGSTATNRTLASLCICSQNPRRVRRAAQDTGPDEGRSLPVQPIPRRLTYCKSRRTCRLLRCRHRVKRLLAVVEVAVDIRRSTMVDRGPADFNAKTAK